MPHDFTLSSSVLTNGRTAYYARLNNSKESRFIVGYQTLYKENIGIYNVIVPEGQAYTPAPYVREFGFWAYFIHPTAKAESQGSFQCLNTYDRAKFTFSFMQYAAHVPNGDFVRFFRKLLALPNGLTYFPKLILKNDRIFYRNSNGTLKQLESDDSTQELMDYLNPSLNEVENQELICSARLVHWAANDPAHRRLQVETAIDHFRDNLVEYDARFDLDKAPAAVCQLICDIRHQGRGTNDRIANALNTSGNWDKAFANLCTIGAVNYQTRINTVKAAINGYQKEGVFNKKYNRAKKAFV